MAGWRPSAHRNAASQSRRTIGDNWHRRVIYAALIDCSTEEAQEWLTGGGSNKPPLRASEIGQFFLTEPTDGHAIHMEFVRKITREDTDTKIHVVVQLYPNPQGED